MNIVKNDVLRIFIIIFLITIMAGCSAGSIMVTGEQRPAIEPSEVKLYLERPKEYEIIGIVEATADIFLSRQKSQDKLVRKLKSRAAKVGANGILLESTGSETEGAVGYFDNGFFYADNGNERFVGKGKAIFVTEE